MLLKSQVAITLVQWALDLRTALVAKFSGYEPDLITSSKPYLQTWIGLRTQKAGRKHGKFELPALSPCLFGVGSKQAGWGEIGSLLPPDSESPSRWAKPFESSEATHRGGGGDPQGGLPGLACLQRFQRAFPDIGGSPLKAPKAWKKGGSGGPGG